MKRYPRAAVLSSTYVPPVGVSDAQLCAGLLADFATAAERGEWWAVEWVASARLELVCDVLRRDVDRVRRELVLRWLAGVREQRPEETRVVELYRQGHTLRAIECETGIGRMTAQRLLRAAGVTRRPAMRVRQSEAA